MNSPLEKADIILITTCLIKYNCVSLWFVLTNSVLNQLEWHANNMWWNMRVISLNIFIVIAHIGLSTVTLASYMGLLINLDHLCNGRSELVSSLLIFVLCYLSVITSVSTSVIIHILSTRESFNSFSWILFQDWFKNHSLFSFILRQDWFRNHSLIFHKYCLNI